MSIEEEEKKFRIIKYWADNELSNRKCFVDEEYFFRNYNIPELSDARILFKLIKKEVEALNSKFESRKTILKNMKYKPKYLGSNVFTGLIIPEIKIENLMKENFDKNAYQVYLLL